MYADVSNRGLPNAGTARGVVLLLMLLFVVVGGGGGGDGGGAIIFIIIVAVIALLLSHLLLHPLRLISSSRTSPQWPLWGFTGASYGLLMGIIALVGDLTASMMKRDAGKFYSIYPSRFRILG